MWGVRYRRLFEEWHPQCLPEVVDAEGATVASVPQFVGHPGEYDEKADGLAHTIASAVNGVESAAKLLAACEQADKLITHLLRTRAIREDEPAFDWNLLNATMGDITSAIANARAQGAAHA